MAARKYNRRRKKRRGGSFILSLLTFCIVVAAIVMSVTVFLKVAKIEVSGLTKYDPNDIIETSGIKLGDNMFIMNKFEIANRILQTYPYIEQIKIRRRLPDTFTFEITERTAAAYVLHEGNCWLVDKKGYLLEMVADVENMNIPKITGVEVLGPYAGGELVLKDAAQLPPLREVLDALTVSEMGGKIVRIDLETLYDIKIVYEDKFLVNLGDTNELPRKIEMLRAVIEQLADFDRGTINVSAVKEARFRPNAGIDLSEDGEKAEKEETAPPSVQEEATTAENAEANPEVPPQ